MAKSKLALKRRRATPTTRPGVFHPRTHNHDLENSGKKTEISTLRVYREGDGKYVVVDSDLVGVDGLKEITLIGRHAIWKARVGF